MVASPVPRRRCLPLVLGFALASAAGACRPGGSGLALRGGEEWTWEGTRRIAEMVEVPPGATLRLRPGTVVEFVYRDENGDGIGDAGLHIRGRILAVGEEGAPVILTSAEESPRPGDWQGLLIENSRDNLLSECLIEYAQYALHTHFSEGRVTRCRLERNIEGTRLGDSRLEISHSLIRGNLSKGLNFRASANHIHHNLITANGNGIFLFETDTESVIERNSLFGNEGYDFRLGDFYLGGKELRDNWWGTTEVARIRERIYDRKQDPELGRVEIRPASEPVVTGWEIP